mgnify:CR=1 FL=1
MDTNKALDLISTKDAYIQFGDAHVRVSESEALRVFQDYSSDIEINEYPDSVVLFIPGGASTGVPSGGLPSQDDLSAKKKLIELYNAVDGKGIVTLTTPKESRLFGQVITQLYVSNGDLVAKFTGGANETLTGVNRFFTNHFEPAEIQDIIDDVNNA